MEDLELIEQYVMDTLSTENRLLAEQKLANEPAFRQLHEKMKILVSTGQKLETRNKIKAIQVQKIRDWKPKQIELPRKRNLSFVKWTSFAAAACLAGVLYLGNANFDMPNEVSLQERGASAANNSESVYVDFIKANELLSNKQYQEAAQLYGKVSADENYMTYYKEMSRWYQIVAFSNIDEAKAKELLSNLEKTPNTKYEIPVLEKAKMKIRLAF